MFFLPTAQVPRLNFVPTPEFPALQYFGELEKGGQADLQGVKTGDFILEVSVRRGAYVDRSIESDVC